MRVVFLEEVEGTAMAGDVKNVADGFARNFLLPRKLAAPATEHYIAIAAQKATKYARRQDRLDAEATERLLPLIDGKSVTIEVRVGEQEKMFGSVTARDIAEAVQAETKVEVDHRQVDLRQPLRETGEHKVPIKLTRNVIATVTVHVIRLGGEEEAEAEAEASAAPAAAAADEATAETAVEDTTAEATEGEAPEASEETAEPAAEDATAEATEAEAPEVSEETAETAADDASAEGDTADEEKPAEAAPEEEHADKDG